MPRQNPHELLVLGEAIRALRGEHDLTRAGLAARSGISEATIAALEDGGLDPDLELLLDLAKGMDIRPAALFLRAEELAAREDA